MKSAGLTKTISIDFDNDYYIKKPLKSSFVIRFVILISRHENISLKGYPFEEVFLIIV